MSTNRLAEETSPYLILHKDNPVDWRPWGAEAFQEAETTGKPILLSIGYTACHWCHVMNHESFADADTASVMNDNFINVKVDREERPDIDQLYQAAAQTMGYQGGWPLTVFLNPRGEPFFVGGYFPNEDRYGQPPFKTVLADVSRLYREQADTVSANAGKVSEALSAMWSRDLRGPLDPRILDVLSVHVAQRFDIFYGGLSGAPKFPNAPLIEVLWRAYLRSGAMQFPQLVQTSLDAMCLSGFYDHVGGGFHRYTVDERWLVPHFEKMLYDNALLVDTLTLVAQHNRVPLYLTRIEETLGWVQREMMVGDGFAASIDADVNGEEGAYYLWSESEIDATLMGTFAQRFKDVYNIRKDGAFMGRNIIHRLGNLPYPLPEADEALLKRQRELLLAARSQTRSAPIRDDKVLADWNGMMISAFANAGRAFNNPGWVGVAARAFDFVAKTMSDGNRLYHSWRDGKRGHMGFADDYAHMTRAALALWEATADKRYLDNAKHWTLVLNEFFADARTGAYYQSAIDDAPLLHRALTVYDQATQSANGTMIGVLAKLYLATGEQAYRDRSNAIINAFAGEVGRSFLAMGSYLNGLETVLAGLQIVIVGPKNSSKTVELVNAVYGRSVPNRLVMVVEPDEVLPETHPAYGKKMENGQPTAYVCQHQNCSAPISNAVTLSQVLQLPARPPQGARPQ
ncbi:MAG: thioredoxin domain-containing protein [Alphaproteobacteria bacterium]|nr:thioredoxin domain-containing protein [Alphaproteobacteria bacterium]MDE2109646.1 thioredoxin domain-containing protein [Alphaproteobacteria bacterium]